ncbi:hypothetical protein HMPREF1986_02303 [Oribacterium sp. oral taxon 078 str. F0263]|nr:hypothetical protein HMPREF1986_02303 [Oribacterium sp. oral taxon 078 str. F0263]
MLETAFHKAETAQLYYELRGLRFEIKQSHPGSALWLSISIPGLGF